MPTIAPLLLALATDSAPPSPAEPEPQPVYETSILGGFGAIGGETTGGLAASFMATHRFEFVLVGFELQGAALFSALGGVGAVGGVQLGSDFSLRALGAVGMHAYDGVGNSLLGDDPGVSGTVPFAGGRLVLGYSFGRGRRGRMFLGGVGLLDEDLERKRESVTYWETNWLFGGEPNLNRSEHTIGQTTWGLLALVGADFDIAPY